MSRTTIKKQCEVCLEYFEAHPSNVYKGKGRFCSISCSSSRQRSWTKQHNVKCSYCKKDFYKNSGRRAASKSGHFFCCRAHRDAALRIGESAIVAIQPFQYRGKKEPAFEYRDYAFNHKAMKCNRCNFDSNLKILVVHHKDRNRKNNTLENLEILCPNCHATEHFGHSVEPRQNYDI